MHIGTVVAALATLCQTAVQVVATGNSTFISLPSDVMFRFSKRQGGFCAVGAYQCSPTSSHCCPVGWTCEGKDGCRGDCTADDTPCGTSCCPIPGSVCTNEADPTCRDPDPGKAPRSSTIFSSPPPSTPTAPPAPQTVTTTASPSPLPTSAAAGGPSFTGGAMKQGFMGLLFSVLAVSFIALYEI